MKLIKASAEIIPQGLGLEGIYKHIELAGRTCYKSLDKITEDSAKHFVDRMIKSGHGAMLEHGTVYLKFYHDAEDLADIYRYNPYSKVRHYGDSFYVTTNMRVIIEEHREHDLRFICEPTEYHEKRVTVKFVTDQGILREFTRHKLLCVA